MTPVRNHPAVMQITSPKNGTHENNRENPPHLSVHNKTLSLGSRLLGMNRPTKNVVTPPNVFPAVATHKIVLSGAILFINIVMKTSSELPGNTLADKKLTTNKPTKDKSSNWISPINFYIL
jgi:hypothetical protein